MNNPKPLISFPIEIRWRDLDAFNHVNNASYLTYLEEARLGWLREIKGEWYGETFKPVVAAINMNYRRAIEWPAQIIVELSCERLGNSSIIVAHRIVSPTDPECLYCDGNVTLVWINPITGKSASLPLSIRKGCEE